MLALKCFKKKLLVCSFLLIREERLERGLWEFVRRDWSAAFQYLNFSRALAASGGVDDGVNCHCRGWTCAQSTSFGPFAEVVDLSFATLLL